jgi:hypothetical protein
LAAVVRVWQEVALNRLPFRSSGLLEVCMESNEDGILSTRSHCEGFAGMSSFQCGGANREPSTTEMVGLQALTELPQQDRV